MSFTLDTPKGDLNPTDSAVKSDDLDHLSIGALTQKFFTETLCLKQCNAHKNAIQNNTPDGIRIHYFSP